MKKLGILVGERIYHEGRLLTCGTEIFLANDHIADKWIEKGFAKELPFPLSPREIKPMLPNETPEKKPEETQETKQGEAPEKKPDESKFFSMKRKRPSKQVARRRKG